MWEVHYSRECAVYLEDNASLISELYFAIEALANSEGMPTRGAFHEMSGMIYWEIESHLVVYRRTVRERVASVLFMKPL